MLESIFSIDIFGYFAGVLLIAMASCRTQRGMRLCNIGANVSWIAFGALSGAMPVLIMNALILAIHAWRMVSPTIGTPPRVEAKLR